MSKIGKQPVKVPQEVKIELKDNLVAVSGPKGSLKQQFRPEVEIRQVKDEIIVKAKKSNKTTRALHGVTRALIANMVEGATKGFEKVLELHGVGYRAALEKEELKIKVGFSHPVVVKPPQGIQFQVEGNNIIKILGADKQKVGQVAAEIRNIRPPEPYKGKGIRYKGEVIKLKPGKAAKIGASEA
jgi:large subunit ribosomal protein L6